MREVRLELAPGHVRLGLEELVVAEDRDLARGPRLAVVERHERAVRVPGRPALARVGPARQVLVAEAERRLPAEGRRATGGVGHSQLERRRPPRREWGQAGGAAPAGAAIAATAAAAAASLASRPICSLSADTRSCQLPRPASRAGPAPAGFAVGRPRALRGSRRDDRARAGNRVARGAGGAVPDGERPVGRVPTRLG